MKDLPEWEASRLSQGSLDAPMPKEACPANHDGMHLPGEFDWKGFRECCLMRQDGISEEDEEVVRQWRARWDALNAAAHQRTLAKQAEVERKAMEEEEKKIAAAEREEKRLALETKGRRMLFERNRASGLKGAELIRRNYWERKGGADRTLKLVLQAMSSLPWLARPASLVWRSCSLPCTGLA